MNALGPLEEEALGAPLRELLVPRAGDRFDREDLALLFERSVRHEARDAIELGDRIRRTMFSNQRARPTYGLGFLTKPVGSGQRRGGNRRRGRYDRPSV